MTALNLGQLLARRAEIQPSLPACIEPARGQTLSYAEYNALANRCAGAMRKLGVGPGDRIALLLPSSSEFMALYYGAAKIGAVVVPLNTRLAAAELAYILADSGAKCLFHAAAFAPLVAGIRECTDHQTSVQHWIDATLDGGSPATLGGQLGDAVEPAAAPGGDANLFIMYTSGTTGRPKGVVHTHDTVLWSALSWMIGMDIRAGDRLWLPLPMFHVAAMIPLILAVQRGLTLVVEAEFNPAQAWKTIEEQQITIGGAVPAILNFMRQVPDFATAKLEQLRCFVTGGAAMPVELIDIYGKRGIEVYQGYSMTETAGGGTFLTSEYARSKVGSVGKPTLYTEIRLVDSDGRDVAAGESGEVLFRGPHLMKEYWNNPKATAETLQDGWLRSGDIAMRDDEGFLFIKDRVKDMIISGGENVYPAEIENVLLGHPGVSEVAVIGQSSEKWGETAFAVVVCKDEHLSEDALLEHCSARLSRFKLPKGFAFVEVIPRNAAGKVLKQELRKQFPGSGA